MACRTVVARNDRVSGLLCGGRDGAPASSASKRRLSNRVANCFREVFRQRCFEIHPALRSWVIEAKFPSVQHLPRKLSGASSAINRVAQDWIPKMLEMDANLMGSTTVQPAFKQARISSHLHDSEIGSCDAPAAVGNGHF